ncbi:MAG: Holliday junction branch migration protein RuvA [Patescibacteria group bacterium]|nr:Holliday junction branch migration protein RuvA [Patescibacteria group bacterium]
MIYTLKGVLVERGNNFFVVECNGIGFKVLTSEQSFLKLPPLGSEFKIFCFLYVREEQFELYGFLEEEGMKLFEMLNTVAGVGPKTALGILDIDSAPNIMAAIIEKRADLLTHASGIGRKTAERIILELANKIKLPHAKTLTKEADLNHEVEEVLVGLGYLRSDARKILEKTNQDLKTIEERLRFALRELGRRKY